MAEISGRGNAAIYLLPGMSAKIEIPGYFVKIGDHKYQNAQGEIVTSTLENGFYIEDENIGTITAVENEPAATYLHKKYGQNRIIFVARTGEQCIIDVIAVPIHDHASIVTGGPAYGTYFTDDETLETTEEDEGNGE